MEATKAVMRRLEKLPVPVVAAINGSALSASFELYLCCHRRIAWNDPSAKLGLPEVKLGLLPGGGGVVRRTYLLGIELALSYLIHDPRRIRDDASISGCVESLAGGPRSGPGSADYGD